MNARRGSRPLLVLAGAVLGLGLAGGVTGVALGSVGGGPDGPGPGHHRHDPAAGPAGGPFADRMAPPDRD